MAKITFPEDFIWGVATSAAQTEGASFEDGKGLSIWDVFSRIPGKIADNTLPEPANDFYHRFREDIRMMKELGIHSLRMSLSWSRLFPSGYGKVNEKGVQFYHEVFEELRKNDIFPNVTLYHWDLPYALQEELGWLNRDTAERFGEYAAFVFREFGAEVPYFTTLNEPIAVYVGYGLGAFAPGIRGEKFGRIANHNLLRAHGLGVQAFRAQNCSDSRIGVVVDVWDKEAAREGNEEDEALALLHNETTHLGYLNPLFRGDYSPFHRQWMEENNVLPDIREGDMRTICQPLDFFGLNCYARVLVSTQEGAVEQKVKQLGGNYQQNGTEFYPKAIYDALLTVKENFTGNLPIFITENGTCKPGETPDSDGEVCDDYRIAYIKGFLEWTRRAMDEGVDVRGYYLWTFLDNWEWTGGYEMPFGIVRCNFQTQERVWKRSAHWYRDVIRMKGWKD